jgi:translation initiation factor IF-2
VSNNPKVFEFAKEVGMTPLALMDKIREWHLPVKSHMAELDNALLATIRAKLTEPATSGESEKKPTTRKKAAATSSTDKPAAAKSAAKPAAKKAAVGAAAPKMTKAAKTVAAPEETPASKASATVVRRKKVEAVPTPEVEVEAPAAEEAAPAEVSAVEELRAAPTFAKEIKLDANEEAPQVQQSAATAAAPQAVAATPAAAAPVEEAAAPVVAAVVRKPMPARKKEVAIGASGVSSEQTAPAAPRRNIVGRMDLSRVQAPPRPGFAPRPGGGTGGGFGGGGFAARGGTSQAGGPGATGFGGANRPNKGNLRAGFFQAPGPDLAPPAATGDFDRKKDDKRRTRGGVAEPASAAREQDAAPPAFDAAEFRKREMVFQPKKKKGMLTRPSMSTQITTPAAHKRIVKVFGSMKVSDLAQAMGIKVPALIKVLMKNGVMATINMDLDFDTISLTVSELGFEAQNIQQTADEFITETAVGEDLGVQVVRSPVVAVMGHVDHGKTSLLDAIRSAKVAAGEAGGITQHIGAYQVTLDDGYKITFLDTPGHEAFTSMRARGANVTDIAIIVVAADDGVMPQTAEAINHAKAAGVPMIIAVNKIDKPGANPDRIKQQLTEYEVVPEEWGGTTIFCNVSALKQTGIKEMLEQIKLLAEIQELKAHPDRSGTGSVIESRLDKGRGSVATILVKDGTVKVGQYIVAGAISGRVRSLTNDRGQRVEQATPGMPVEVLGLNGVPQAGDKFDVVKDERSAEDAARIRQDVVDAQKNTAKKMSLEEIFAKVQKGDVKQLDVVLKADVAGSLDALQGMFQKLSTPEVKVRVIHAAIGGITETDAMLASTAKGIVIGFNVRPDSGAQAAAKRYGIDIRTYSIVYELVDEMKKAMAGLLSPDIVERVAGKAEVRNVFNVPKIGAVAGCMVSEGKILRTNMARLIRDGKIVYEGKLASLKRFKDDAREVAAGFECGIGIENFNDVKVGDIIEAFSKEEVARELTQAPSKEA